MAEGGQRKAELKTGRFEERARPCFVHSDNARARLAIGTAQSRSPPVHPPLSRQIDNSKDYYKMGGEGMLPVRWCQQQSRGACSAVHHDLTLPSRISRFSSTLPLPLPRRYGPGDEVAADVWPGDPAATRLWLRDAHDRGSRPGVDQSARSGASWHREFRLARTLRGEWGGL